MRRSVLAIGRARIAVALSAVALAVALSGVTAAEAVRAVKRVLNADAVDGISASRTPRPGQLLALGADRRFPAGVLPASVRGPRGAEGPAGQIGLPGARGPAGASNIRITNGAPVSLSQSGGTATQVARLDNLPAGSWLFAWSATLDYGVTQAIDVVCYLQTGQQTSADADTAVGAGAGAAYAQVLGSFGATGQNQPFSVQLLCSPATSTSSAVHVDSQRVVAIRADTLDVTG
jgi:hypothetical protein